MKTYFIETRSDVDVAGLIQKVPKGKVYGLVTTAQHVHKLPEVQKLLPQSVMGGQVLGCNAARAVAIKDKVDAFLFLGTGDFHPIEVAMETGKDVYMADPLTNQVTLLPKEEIEKRQKRMKGAYIRYLNSTNIGIIVSKKPGQHLLKEAQRLKEYFEKKGKKGFIFLCDTLDFHGLNDFTEIECWINTACSRIAIEDYEKLDKPILNIYDLKVFEKQETTKDKRIKLAFYHH